MDIDVVGDAGKASLDTEQLPKFLAHLGFHAHPTKTPTITATQRGIMNVMSSLSIPNIVGLRKISNKAESKAITKETEKGDEGTLKSNTQRRPRKSNKKRSKF